MLCFDQHPMVSVLLPHAMVIRLGHLPLVGATGATCHGYTCLGHLPLVNTTGATCHGYTCLGHLPLVSATCATCHA